MTATTPTTTPIAAAFVLHSPTLVNRAPNVRNLESLLSRMSASVRVVSSHEPSEVVGNVQQLVDLDPSHLEDAAFRPLVRSLQVRQVSSALKHAAALRAIAEDGGDSTAFRLVVEDDCLFGDQAEQVVRGACAAAPADADIVFLGLPSPKPPGQAPVFDDVFSVFNLLPACDSYLIRPAAAAKLVAAFFPVRLAANLHLTHLIKARGLSARICVPNAFVDGTKLGVFACAVDANSKLLWNQQFCQMELLLRSDAPTYNAAEFEALAEAQPFKQHPDVLSLVAQHLERCGRYAEAEQAYGKAVAAYDNNGCIVNNTSEVLRKYAALYRHLQPDLVPA